jgi:hypothetical protein
LYEFYFQKDFTRHDEFLEQAAACYADVVNFDHRMEYYFDSKEANDQVWFMAEWLLAHKHWTIISGMVQKPFAAEIGTFIFNGLHAEDATNADGQQKIWGTMREYIKKYAPYVAAYLIRILIHIFLIPEVLIPIDIQTFLDNN